jgi:hypothetical protein
MQAQTTIDAIAANLLWPVGHPADAHKTFRPRDVGIGDCVMARPKVFSTLAGAALLASAFAGSAQASILLDGLYDSDYGAATAVVTADSAAPNGNFDSPGTTNTIGYSIYLAEQGGSVYGLLRANSDATGALWANLYFDLDPANNNGSDLGFEIANLRAFIPGVDGYAPTPGVQFATSADNMGFEFSIPDSYFTAAIAGLTYNSGQVFPGPGGDIVLRLSQSFGYAVAGGATYGDTRLGEVALATSATPLPAALPLLAGGLGMFGLLLRGSRKRKNVSVLAS